MEGRGLKYYGWRSFSKRGQARLICAAPTKVSIERLLDRRINSNSDCFCTTANKEEVALLQSHPDMTIMYQPYRGNCSRSWYYLANDQPIAAQPQEAA